MARLAGDMQRRVRVLVRGADARPAREERTFDTAAQPFDAAQCRAGRKVGAKSVTGVFLYCALKPAALALALALVACILAFRASRRARSSCILPYGGSVRPKHLAHRVLVEQLRDVQCRVVL